MSAQTTNDLTVKNRLQPADEAIHGWYRFVLGYPPHLVREYLNALMADPEGEVVFDPFCGTATTPVEARLQGFSTLCSDANPICALAARVKLSWEIDLNKVGPVLDKVLECGIDCFRRFGLDPQPSGRQLPLIGIQPDWQWRAANTRISQQFDPDALLTREAASLIPTGFISSKPLLRVLALRFAIQQLAPEEDVRSFLMLALASVIVSSAANVAFGPEIYRTPPREDADVIGEFASTVAQMIADLRSVREKLPSPVSPARVFADDARTLLCLDGAPPIGVVITSPPYPNEKDYTRITRLESVLLGLITSKRDLRIVKSRLLCSNTRTVSAGNDDDRFVKDIPSVVHLAEQIEQRRLELHKQSGFERLYHRVVSLYFGGMYRHFTALLPHLRPGARCAYVVGDQMSFFRIHIRTAHLLADVAIKAGYDVEGIQLWRTRRSTATGQDLEEHVLILKRPASGKKRYA